MKKGPDKLTKFRNGLMHFYQSSTTNLKRELSKLSLPSSRILEQELQNSSLIDSFTAHLIDIKKNFNVDSFIFFLDKKETQIKGGRLFYHVDGKKNDGNTYISNFALKDKEIPDPLKKEVLHAASDFNKYFEIVGNLLEKNKSCQDLFQDFEKKYPDKADQFKRFVAAQAGFVLYEKVQKMKFDSNKDVKSYQKANKNEKMKLEATYKKVGKKLNKDLKKARLEAIEFYEPKEQKKKKTKFKK